MCADDPEAAAIGAAHGAITVGTSAGSTYTMERRRAAAQLGLVLAAWARRRCWGPCTSACRACTTPRNGALAAVAALQAGAPFAAAQAALARFAGVTRRFEFRGESPWRDVRGRLRPPPDRGARRSGDGADRRLVPRRRVFQPHRYSRTAALADEFGTAFGDADVLVVTDVYSAGERPVPGVSGRLVADAVRAQDPRLPVIYVAGWEELRQAVAAQLRPGDLCLTLGAGDLTTLPDDLLESAEW